MQHYSDRIYKLSCEGKQFLEENYSDLKRIGPNSGMSVVKAH